MTVEQLTLAYPFAARPRISPAGMACVGLAHALALAALVMLDVVPVPPQVSTLMVQILPAAESMPQALPAVLPKPQPPQARPLPRAATLSSQAPTSVNAPAMEIRESAPPVPAAPSAEAVVTQPRFDANYLDNPAPAYPALSRRMGEEGKVLLRVQVEANGQPSRIELKQSSGSSRLDQAAEQAVWRWKFIPAKRGNEALAAWVVVPISFNLRD